MDVSQRVTLMVARIKALMQQQGLSDADLARRTGISPGTLSRVLSMVTEDPRISTVLQIADALGSTVGYLLHSERIYPIPILGWDEILDFSRGNCDIAPTTRWLTVDTPRKPGTFAARATSAMAPRFREGSLLIVEPVAAFRDGQVIVAALNGRQPTLHRLIRDGEAAWLKSITPSPAEMINACAQGVTVLGAVTESRLITP